jgi:molybdenum cofactor synthesis domain-containing protein
MARVVAVCRSERKGGAKAPQEEIVLREDWGVEGDAHAGPGPRQVSLLARESIEEMKRRGAPVELGSFGENVVVEGTDLATLCVGVELGLGETLLEITEIGKVCHTPCAIFAAVGDCIMPREGIFGRVVRDGPLRPGDPVVFPRGEQYSCGVLTVSDSAARGEREDLSGPLLVELAGGLGLRVARRGLVPDDRAAISRLLAAWSDDGSLDLILTTGGTGLSPRDITPEATLDVLERRADGIPEMLRAGTAAKTMRTYLSRGAAGTRGRTLIVNLPGSRKAVRECFEVFAEVLDHALGILTGGAVRCGG